MVLGFLVVCERCVFFGTSVLIILRVVVVIHISEFLFTIFASKA